MLDEREIRRLVLVCQRSDRDAGAGTSGGDATAAWATLYAHFHPLVRGLCFRLMPDRAEDAAAETLLRARVRIASCDPMRPFAPWLFRIAANACWDEARRAKRRAGPLDEADGDRRSEEPSPLQALIMKEDRNRVRTTVARLPARQRFALTLRYGADLSYQEIAETLGTSSSNVGVLLLRARRQVRAMLIEGDA